MRFLILKPVLWGRSNGGEISLGERAMAVRKMGHDVRAYITQPLSFENTVRAYLQQEGFQSTDSGYRWSEIECDLQFDTRSHFDDLQFQASTEHLFLNAIERHRAEYLIVHYTDFFAVTAAIKASPERTWVVVTDDEYPRLDALKNFQTIYPAYQKIQNFVVASRFMRASVRSSFKNARVVILHNPISTSTRSDHASLSERDAFVFINPVKVKGVDFVMQLAESMPSEKFLTVGNWTNDRPDRLPPNMIFIPRQSRLDAVFSRARALLMPSVWNEAFGRVPLEAMAAGVPVIASDRGALSETIGEGGRVLPLELSAWQKAIQETPDQFSHWSEMGLRRFRAYQDDVARRYQALQRALSQA